MDDCIQSWTNYGQAVESLLCIFTVLAVKLIGCMFIVLFTGALNQYVDIKFESLSLSFECQFIDQETSDKMCSIAYAPRARGQCIVKMMQKSEGRDTNLRSVTINLHMLPYSQGNEYCFEVVAAANNGTFTARIEGLFNAGIGTVKLDNISVFSNN